MTSSQPDTVLDLVVIGGGVNGCGIARDAAGRGLTVMLVEQGDLASGTSQWSTKLIHGGLRYLEHYAFRLVRESLQEREVLLRASPHIARPLRFVLPHDANQRPAWLLRVGLFLYDHLGGREILPGTRTLDLRKDEAGAPLREGLVRGFEYSDCWVDDARLVVLCAMDAAERGAQILTRTRCVSARIEDGLWRVELERPDGTREIRAARALVVAAGPWIREAVTEVVGESTTAPVRLVRGSHIVTRKLFDHPRAYIFQNTDGRIVFAIPYETDFTLIGTTDEEHRGDPARPKISEAEIDYLLAAVSRPFRRAVTRADIVWTYSGIRPLYDDGASAAKDATRDYVLDLDKGAGRPPRITVYGGKITTYRRLAEHALGLLAPHMPKIGGAWTSGAMLPGGDFPVLGFDDLVAELARDYPAFARTELTRLARLYGTRTRRILGTAKTSADLGRAFGAGLSEAEVDYLVSYEFARAAEDVLWRRTKLGLRLDREAQEALAEHMGG